MDRPPAEGQAHAQALARLRERFVAGLPARWQAIDGAPDTASRVAALHQLTGAAGAYGLEGLSLAARQAEQALARGDAAQAQAALAELRLRLAEAGVTVR